MNRKTEIGVYSAVEVISQQHSINSGPRLQRFLRGARLNRTPETIRGSLNKLDLT